MADNLGPEHEQSDDGLDGGLVDGQGNSLAGDHRREQAKKKAARYRSRPDAAMVQRETRRAAVKCKGLKCPRCECQNFAKVADSRPGDDSRIRKRVCRSCGYEFTTHEIVTSDLGVNSTLAEQVARRIAGG